jgi:hypothetical protein
MRKKGLIYSAFSFLLLASCDCGTIDLSDQPDGDGSDGAGDTVPVFDNFDPAFDAYRDPDPGESCQPPAGVWTYFTIDGTDWPRSERIFYQSQCVLVWLSSGNRGTTLSLACRDEGGDDSYHDVVVATDIDFNWTVLDEFEGGEAMTFTYVAETSFWASRWFFMKAPDGRLLLAGIDAHALLPEYDVPEFYGQLQLSVVEGPCEVEEAECGATSRLAVDLSDGAGSARVFDETASMLYGPAAYYITVGMAERYVGPWTCGGQMPDRWFSILLYQWL